MKNLLILGSLFMSLVSNASAAWQGSAVLVVKPEKVEEFKQAVAKIIQPTRLEKGCITYYGYQVIDPEGNKTNRFEFHEIWTTKEAMLIDHKENAPHMKKFFNDIKADTKDSFLLSFEVSGKYVDIIKGEAL